MPSNYPSLNSLLQQAEDLVVSRKHLPTDPDALQIRRAWLRHHLTKALGYIPPHEAPLAARTESKSVPAEGLIEEAVAFDRETGGPMRGVLTRPAETPDPLPAVILLHGWDLDKTGVNSTATSLARAGYVVLRPGNQCVSGSHGCVDGESCEHLGMTYMGLTTYENMRGLDYLCSREDVDADRVAAVGMCWSGVQCYVLAALDERVKAACAICGIAPQGTLPTDFAFAQGHMCIGSFLPGFLEEAGIQDLMALIAPRPLLVQNNVTEEWYPVLGFRSAKAETKMVYRTMGHPERFDARVETSSRDLTPQFIENAVEWLDRHL
ncbi:MAG: dienelactone hydrolase family protein [Armatimonadetes bacterium]|nr:dienelactone hydrolase family protein [Armatimonadota bacterium]